MKLAFLVLAIAAAYVVGDDDFGDAKCFQEKLTPCFGGIYASIIIRESKGEKIEPCSVIPQAVKCLSDSATACQIKQSFEDLKNTYTEACTKGTDLYNKLEANEECISKQTSAFSSCVKVKTIKDPTPEQVVEMQKDVCRQLDSIPPCVGKEIEKACGKDAAEVAQKLITPLFKLAEPVCAEILKGAASSIFVSSYSIFFALAVALFIWMRQ
ncbi:uncharacterized protein LOC129224451 [Uloborus diversus]|uniref:uncharacterized protein LOC129224451 n=1 Tax=Uloborus diversus TaxID=327109 RepID=UPI00240A010F|nr:uncharacterized protein LOC129224451 [Uloborus diversus]